MVESYSPGGGNVSFHEGTLVPLGEYDWTCASFGRPPEFTTQTTNRLVKPFLHSRQKVPIVYNGRPYPPELPLPMRGSGAPSNTWFTGSMRAHNPNSTSIGSAVFAQMSAECPYTLQCFTRFPTKLPLPMGDLDLMYYMIPWAHPSPQPKWQLDRFSHFCRAH